MHLSDSSAALLEPRVGMAAHLSDLTPECCNPYTQGCGRPSAQVYLERQDARPDGSAGSGRAPDSANWAAVARLLSRKHDRIDSLHALDLLPGQVSGPSLSPYFKNLCEP